MTKQNHYEVEDFLLNESFIEWVLNDSEKESVFWNAWIAAHPACQNEVNIAKKILTALHVKPVRSLTETEIGLLINTSQERARAGNNGKVKYLSIIKYKTFTKIAAVIFIAVSLSYLFYRHFETHKDKFVNNEVVVMHRQVNKTKGTIVVKLPDGTSIILKPNATITYPTSFKGKNREVTLNGEAFFEVHKDANHPFLVHSGEWVTRVLGTSFTIKMGSQTKEFKVTVNTGKVMVYKVAAKIKDADTLANAIYITPNQQVIYNVAQNNTIKQNLSNPTLLSADHAKELFTFHETPLNNVIANIEKAYNVNVIYNKKQIGGCPLTASLSDQHLLEKLDLISKALNLHYLITDEGQIMLAGEGCNNIN